MRVAWLPRERDGARRAGVRDLLSLSNPRRPSGPAQERIVPHDSGRYRVLVGGPARVSELRRRFESGGGGRFDAFVERQGVLTLERAERELVGGHYKVPRLVLEKIQEGARFRSTVARLAEDSGRGLDAVAEEAAGCLEEMVASLSRLAIDAWDQFGRWVSRAYTLDVDTSRIEELRRLNRSHALVFLPSHRSYLDPLVLRPVLRRHGFPPQPCPRRQQPGLLAGRAGRPAQRVRVHPPQLPRRPGLQGGAARVSGLSRPQALQPRVVHRGWTHEDGKLRPPRYGILSYLVDAFRAELVAARPEHGGRVGGRERGDRCAPRARADDGDTWLPAHREQHYPVAMRRTDQRRAATFALYQHDLTGRPLDDVFRRDARPFTRALAHAVQDHRDELDGVLERHATGWTVDRIAPLERSILRVGLLELLYPELVADPEPIPPEAAIDEAVETAKTFCGAETPKFVNGILGTVLREREGSPR